MPATYTCSHCDREHPGLPTDWGFLLPDEVHALGLLERYARARHTADLCTLDEVRHFIRTLLPLRLNDDSDGLLFAWGVWIEVDRATHDLYIASWHQDISDQPRRFGRIANEISVYGSTVGLPVEVQFLPGTDRPSVWLAPGTSHALAIEQRDGITGKRHHDILQALGHFE